MIQITSRRGLLLITPVPPELEKELSFWEMTAKTKGFFYRDRDSGEFREGVKRDGYKSEKIGLITTINGVGCCNRGLLRRIVTFLDAMLMPWQFIEENPLTPFHFGPDVVAGLRPEQMRNLMNILVEIGSGQVGGNVPGSGKVPPSAGSAGALISATMATGKTTIIAALIRCFPTIEILVITKKKAVIRRLETGLMELLPDIKDEIGVYFGDKKMERRITVCSEALLDAFDVTRKRLLIHDEVHNSSGEAISVKLASYTLAIKVGFSGTIERHSKFKFIESLFGPVVDTISDQEAEELGRVTKMTVYVVKVDKGPDIAGLKEHILEREGITENHRRNLKAKEVVAAAPENLQLIMFVRTVDHIDRLTEKYLEGFTVYHGGLPNSVRKDIEERFCAGQITRLLATDAFSEGVDTTHVSIVCEWGWSGTDQTVSQRAGRSRRRSEGKYRSLVITPSDDWEIATEIPGAFKENPLLNKRRKRVLNYKKRGWPVVKVKSVKDINFSQITQSDDENSGDSQT